MAEDVVRDLLHVLRRRVGPPVQEGVAARGEVEGERGARRGAYLYLLLEGLEPLRALGFARDEDDVEDVVRDLLVAIDLL